ncbi:MAG: aminodeoxychorismate/anthranilate synthase component II [Bacteroidetes bacterium]|nr:aminodeoxychorismate/anthranilate synthase component II [Bacteroidota bacterium]
MTNNPHRPEKPGTVLLLDNYDSFAFNLLDYLLQLGWNVEVRQNDRIDAQGVLDMAPQAVVISPGPRRPAQAGQLMPILRAVQDHVPVLGICLGHQALGECFGARLVHGAEPVHGKTAQVFHNGDALFAGLPNPFPVMRYHSLVLEDVRAPLRVVASTEPDGCGVVMALRHTEKPLWGLQFHPESIGTPDGLNILRNWTQMALVAFEAKMVF